MSMKPSLLFEKLAEKHVEVVVIGGFAAVTWGIPYVTQDIDLCFKRSSENIVRLSQALIPLHPRLRVQGLTDEEAQILPFQLDK